MNKFKYIATEKLKLEFKEGDKVRINGVITFGQDLSWWEGDFDKDRIFTVRSVLQNSKLQLVAPGYGDLSGNHENYGNGAIFVYKSDFDKLEKV